MKVIQFVASAKHAEALAFYRDVMGFTLVEDSPFAIEFDAAGYGRAKGIPTILLAASGLNSVAAVVGFGMIFSVVVELGDGVPAWGTLLLGLAEVFGLFLVRIHLQATIYRLQVISYKL